LKDFAFELQVPADAAFRSIAADAAGQYAESVGLVNGDAKALAVSLQETVDLAAGAADESPVCVAVSCSDDHLDVTISAGGESSTVSRTLAAKKGT